MRTYPPVTSLLVATALCPHLFANDDAIRAAFDDLVAADHWRERSAISKRLVEFGDAALPQILKGTKHDDKNVREHCFRILYDHFLTDPRSHRAFLRGLKDADHRIAYSCAFWSGEVDKADSEPALREVMKHAPTELIRFAAAKSLAELGHQDVIDTLYHGLGNDRYMPRYLSNLGIKALTGKDLNGFDYDYAEGAFVSGGAEFTPARRPIHDAEMKASRFRAIAAYCRWLREEKPTIYLLLDPHTSIAITIAPIEFGPSSRQTARHAWKLICDARKVCEEARLDEAKRLLQEAFTHSRALLDAFAEPGVREENRPSRKHLLNAIKFYQEVLHQLDEPLPDDFPLKGLIQTGQDAQ